MKKSDEPLYSLTLRLPLSLYEELTETVKKSGVSSTEYIRRAIQAALDKERPAAPRSWTDDELRAKIAAMEDDLEAMKLYLKATGKIPEKTGKNNPLKINAKTGENA